MDQILDQSIILSFDGLNLETDLSPSTSKGLINELPIEVIFLLPVHIVEAAFNFCFKYLQPKVNPNSGYFEKLELKFPDNIQ